MTDKKTVLVVDDEPDTVAFLTTLLEDNGFATVAAGDGAQARAILEDLRPDLISLDITMPEKSGVRFYREVRDHEDLKALPIIIVTGISSEFEQFISSRKQVPPPDGYGPKPSDKERFIQLATELTS